MSTRLLNFLAFMVIPSGVILLLSPRPVIAFIGGGLLSVACSHLAVEAYLAKGPTE